MRKTVRRSESITSVFRDPQLFSIIETRYSSWRWTPAQWWRGRTNREDELERAEQSRALDNQTRYSACTPIGPCSFFTDSALLYTSECAFQNDHLFAEACVKERYNVFSKPPMPCLDTHSCSLVVGSHEKCLYRVENDRRSS